MADLLVLPRPEKSVQNGASFSRKNLNIPDLLKMKEWPQCHRGRAAGKYAGAALAKTKRNRAVCLEYQIMRGRESKWARAAPWRERGGS